MSIRRNPFASNSHPSSGGAPAPPPYSPMASQQQYAPPPGPPPGHVSASTSSPYGAPPGPPPPSGNNMMNADPRTYVSGSSYSSSSSPSTTFQGTSGQESALAAHAKRLSQDLSKGSGGGSSNPFGSASSRQPSIKENQLELLKSYDCIFIVDDSSSMNVNERPDGSMGQSRWEEARDALAGMVELAARMDDDGVDVHFLNSEKCLLGARDPQAVKALFDSIIPDGVTPMGTKLEMLLLQYLDDIETYKSTKSGKEPKKRNYICLTDGSPTDDPESVIVAVARRLDRGNFPLSQIGIQFLQVGNDPEAKEALEELDDALSSQHSIRDIVDTVLYSNLALNPEMILKALLGGINRRLDRQKSQGQGR